MMIGLLPSAAPSLPPLRQVVEARSPLVRGSPGGQLDEGVLQIGGAGGGDDGSRRIQGDVLPWSMTATFWAARSASSM